MNDHDLVNKILQNNKQAIRFFYKTYEKRLLKFILRKVDNLKDAEEILQDTFVSSLDSLPLFSFKSSLFTWLCSISHHEIVDFYRRSKIKSIVFSRLPFLKKIVDEALSPELSLLELEAKEKISLTLKNLSEGYHEILRLKYIDGLTLAQIAKKIGKTVKGAESQLFRARTAFRKEYAKEFSIFNFSRCFNRGSSAITPGQFSMDKKIKQILNSSFD